MVLPRLFSILSLFAFLFSAAATFAASEDLPLIIAQSEEGIKYLWRSVQNGYFHNVLPEHKDIELAWKHYLQSDGAPRIQWASK